MGRGKVCHITPLVGSRRGGIAELMLIAAPGTFDGAADAPRPKGKKSAYQAAMGMDNVSEMIAGAQAFASRMYPGDGMKQSLDNGNKNSMP